LGRKGAKSQKDLGKQPWDRSVDRVMLMDPYENALRVCLRPSPETEALAREVVDAAFVVHCELGPGFLESVYEQALVVELEARAVSFERQVNVPIMFRSTVVGEHRLDLLVGGRLVVELKALDAHFNSVHVAQGLSYLKATGAELGLLINFGLPTLKAGLKRLVPRATVRLPTNP
jgi:GxxExxY protein